MLENYNLKTHLQKVRQELSHALYQHDAACRVIARVIQERDDSKMKLTILQQKISQGQGQQIEEEVQEQQEQKLDQILVNRLKNITIELNGQRKKNRKNQEYIEQFQAVDQFSAYKLQLPKEQITGSLIDNQENYIIIANGKNVKILNQNENNIIYQTDLNDNIKKVQFYFLKNLFEDNIQALILTPQSIYNITYNKETKEGKSQSILNNNIIDFDVHPLQDFLIYITNTSVIYHNLITNSQIAQKTLENNLTAIKIHPDGNFIGLGTESGQILVLSIINFSVLSEMDTNVNQPIKQIQYSELGVHMAVLQQTVKLFSLKDSSLVSSFDSESNFVEFDKSGRVICFGKQNLEFIEFQTMKKIATFEIANINSFKFEEKSKGFVIAGKEVQQFKA